MKPRRPPRSWLGLAVIVLSLALNLPALAAAPTAPIRQQGTHIVQEGENLFRISLRYGTTVDALMAANNLNSIYIYVGQELVLPGGAAPAESAAEPPSTEAVADGSYEVKPGDTLSSIAVRYGVSVYALVQANGLTSWSLIYAGQRLTIPGFEGPSPATAPRLREGDTYVVKAGDTLTGIAQRFGTTAVALARLNAIANPSMIYAGQVLQLTGTPPAPPPGCGGGKRIVVSLSQQHLYAYEGDRLVYSFVASTGAAPYLTRAGEFRIQSKIPRAYGSAWNIWMPHWLGIYWAGSTENGIHALPVLPNGQILWAGYLGTPVSYGCVVLGTYEAQLLYEWAEIGTPVSIRH